MIFGMKRVAEAKAMAEEAERLAKEAGEKLAEAFKDNSKAVSRLLGGAARNDNDETE